MRTPMPPSTINKAATKLISLQGTKRPRNNLSAKSFSAMAHSVRNGLPLCNTLLEALRFLTRKLVARVASPATSQDNRPHRHLPRLRRDTPVDVSAASHSDRSIHNEQVSNSTLELQRDYLLVGLGVVPVLSRRARRELYDHQPGVLPFTLQHCECTSTHDKLSTERGNGFRHLFSILRKRRLVFDGLCCNHIGNHVRLLCRIVRGSRGLPASSTPPSRLFWLPCKCLQTQKHSR